jgi:pimeloyl-ACP methyl ester carboxylesterase
MIEPLAKLMDWSAIQLVALMKPSDSMQQPRLDEGIKFLEGPQFIPDESQPAQVEFEPGKPGIHFRFPSPQPDNCPENNIVHGRLYRCPGQWRQRPVIILLHGWGDFASYKFRFPSIARKCNRAGFNVATLVAPYHFQRRPRQRAAFSSPDVLQLAQATAQGIAEIRASIGWLLGEGCPAVALWGFSMGAHHAGITVCHDARPAAVVLACPPARLRPWVEEGAVRPRARARLPEMRRICGELNLTPLNVPTTQPLIPRKNILLVEGIYDLICLKEDVEDLWHAWKEPDITRLRHGHVGVCCGFARELPRRVLRWLSPRLNVAAQPQFVAK